jgi:hypothetical protein
MGTVRTWGAAVLVAATIAAAAGCGSSTQAAGPPHQGAVISSETAGGVDVSVAGSFTCQAGNRYVLTVAVYDLRTLSRQTAAYAGRCGASTPAAPRLGGGYAVTYAPAAVGDETAAFRAPVVPDSEAPAEKGTAMLPDRPGDPCIASAGIRTTAAGRPLAYSAQRTDTIGPD